MCGRYTFTDTKDLQARFKLQNEMEGLTPRFNAAPGQLMPVIEKKEGTVAEVMRWGLIPVWAKDPKIGYRMINARAETLMDKPTWKRPFLSKRCLVPASGFYEWQHTNGKQPYYITVKDQPLVAFAGLYDEWLDAEKRPLRTFSIITVAANELVGKLHDRMPAIMNPEWEASLLDPENRQSDKLLEMLVPYPAAKMTMYPVDQRVNNTRNDDESLCEPSR